ncbi:hypothetical protein BOX15_Mlig011753g3 [Macrostomum lignano]|nr:hypothetical protein BOX15_Mlig011753g4 [Macrostomum lignano]PAA47800.1 hypothetical protein BOX15_Mlig011753g3 [Macrostomum lignano]
MQASSQVHKTGMSRFLENIRKADLSAMRMLEEKILKTMEGAGYASLFKDDVKKIEVLLDIFADYNLLMQDGKDEESMLNNLANHVRTRIKYFDKLQQFYDNPINRDDHTAHVFSIPNMDVADVHEELVNLRPKRMHQLDEKKIKNLYALFKDDYSTAKTTLIADGTQPVVLNRKKMDRVKRYVDECLDWKGATLVPYVPEMNFFGLTILWKREQESVKSTDTDIDALKPNLEKDGD